MPRRAKVHTAPAADLGPPEIGAHGDFRLLELPVLGRRRQREPLHERLWAAGRISGAEYEAAETYARAWSTASGAVEREWLGDRVDGGGRRSYEPPWPVLEAQTWLREAQQELGLRQSALIEAACCLQVSTRELARRFASGEGGSARARVEDALATALKWLAGWQEDRRAENFP